MELPIQDRPSPLTSNYGYSRTITPMESIASLSSTYSGTYVPTTFHTRGQENSTPSSIPHIPQHHPYTSRPTPTRTFTQTSDELAIAALEQLSHHFLAENKIPGYRHRSHTEGEREGGYERTRAVRRPRKDSIIQSQEKGLMKDKSVLRKDGKLEVERGEKEGSVKGWRKLRPSSSGGRSFKSNISPPPVPSPNISPIEVLDIRGENDRGLKGRLTRMRSISSTRLPISGGIGLGIEFGASKPPIPPKAPSRPKHLHKSSYQSNLSGVDVPLLLSPVEGHGRGVKGEIPRGVLRDSMNSRTGTEVTL